MEVVASLPVCLAPEMGPSFEALEPKFPFHLVDSLEAVHPPYLEFSLDQAPCYVDQEKRKFSIDFDQNHILYLRKQLRGKQEPLAKALSGSKGYKRIHDLTLGMGADAVTILRLGYEVTGSERSPLLAFLLKAAVQRTQSLELKKLIVYEGDGADFIKTNSKLAEIEVLYFDPMYPHKKKSALPKQEMQIFRGLVGDDLDASSVLELALKSTVPRIVVKRPAGAEYLFLKPSHSIETKVVRWDIYQR